MEACFTSGGASAVAMESLLTEMYSLNSPKAPTAQSMSERREMVSGLRWDRRDNCKAKRGDHGYQKKQQQQLEAGAREDPLVQGAEYVEQSSQEVKRPLQQEAKGEKCRLQGGDLIRQEEGLESNGWRLDWESESVHEESLGPPSFPSCRSSPSPRWEPLCSAAWISPPPLSLLQDLLGLLLLLPLAPDVQERQKGAAVTS
uniref:uncharacterized protein LOC114606916 isoform X3 n=1 Tax=Podarcis muralis TaxID=64176 RepID=UPI00109FEB02|nr:uncharacterized protein LOC114606916 isoform X3 [Podarcis muralis]